MKKVRAALLGMLLAVAAWSPAPAAASPDLSVHTVRIVGAGPGAAVVAGRRYTVAVTVKNVEGREARSLQARGKIQRRPVAHLVIDGRILQTRELDLAALQGPRRQVSVQFAWTPARAGSHKVGVVLGGGEGGDRNRANDFKELRVTAAEPVPTAARRLERPKAQASAGTPGSRIVAAPATGGGDFPGLPPGGLPDPKKDPRYPHNGNWDADAASDPEASGATVPASASSTSSASSSGGRGSTTDVLALVTGLATRLGGAARTQETAPASRQGVPASPQGIPKGESLDPLEPLDGDFLVRTLLLLQAGSYTEAIADTREEFSLVQEDAMALVLLVDDLARLCAAGDEPGALKQCQEQTGAPRTSCEALVRRVDTARVKASEAAAPQAP